VPAGPGGVGGAGATHGLMPPPRSTEAARVARVGAQVGMVLRDRTVASQGIMGAVGWWVLAEDPGEEIGPVAQTA
jgi:hypothetical protein